jgi:GDP-L-fucose synthase
MHNSDLADACVFLMSLPDTKYETLLGENDPENHDFYPPMVNVGVGKDISIKELAELMKEVTDFSGNILFDASKPDGTPRKLLDLSLIADTGWNAKVKLRDGITWAVQDFVDNSVVK